MKRNAGDEISFEYVSELLPCLRCCNIADIPYLRMKELFADEEEVNNNEQEHAGALKSGHRGNAASLEYFLPHILTTLTTAYRLTGLALKSVSS